MTIKSLESNPLAFKEFSAQIYAIWDQAVQKNQIKQHQAGQGSAFIEKCHNLYLNAFHGKLPFMVLGWDKLCETPEMLYNFGVLTTGKPFCRAPILGPVQTEMNQGAVLSQEDWCVALNDSYILGTVHAGKTVHLYEPEGKLQDKSLWVGNRPRVLGRELLMLQAAGYRLAEHPYKQLERVFVINEPSQAQLTDLIAAAERATSLYEIRKFMGETRIKSAL